MEWANLLISKAEKGLSRETLETYLIMMSPVAPHVAEELWAFLGHKQGIFESRPQWPEHEEEHLHEEEYNLVVQVNGKMRELVRVPKSLEQSELEAIAKERPKVASSLEGKSLRKVIYVPHKLLNFVVG